MKKLSNILFIAILGAIMASCGAMRNATQNNLEERESYKDSAIYKIRDSVVVIPRERIVDLVAPYDTLYLQTTCAVSKAYIDTSMHLLRGSIESKDIASFQERVVERERVVIQTDTVTRKETIEVPKEVIKYKRGTIFYLLLSYFLITIISFGIYIYFKFLH